MKRFWAALAGLWLVISSHAAWAKTLTAEQIVERNVAARGGLKAWRDIHGVMLSGVLRTGKADTGNVPVVLRLMRPHFHRLDIRLKEMDAVQVSDGAQGWKLRRIQGQNVVMPYMADDAISARAWHDLDPPLTDHESKGMQVELEGSDRIEGHSAYRLKLTRADGGIQHVWIDEKTFLDVRFDDALNRADGRTIRMESIYRDFRKIEGVLMPSVIEIGSDSGGGRRTMVFDRMVVNPPMEASLFDKPKPSEPARSPTQSRGFRQPAVPGGVR